MTVDVDPVEALCELVDRGESEHLKTFLHKLPPEETAYTITHLDDERRSRMFALLAENEPEFAADLMEHFVDAHAAHIVGGLEPEVAAAIVDEMDSDEQADVLAELPEEDAEAILDEMDPAEASDTRRRLRYEENTAGGLMVTEYLAYPAEQRVDEIAEDLRNRAEELGEFEVRNLYAADSDNRFIGLVPMRRLVLSPRATPLAKLALPESDTLVVDVDMPVDDLEDLFDRIDFFALPVVDEEKKLVGVIQRSAVQEYRGEQAEEDLAKVSGIVGGEELRTMPTFKRATRRLMFLVPIMGLMMISAGVISMFRDTVESLPIIAAFLPLVAGLCGSGGNQAVAVSMREISLGLIKPADFWRVAGKEAAVAIMIGLVLGLLLTGIVTVWENNVALGIVIGAAVPTTITLAAVIGGGVPLLLRLIKLDPAMASGPTVTTMVDLLAYFSVLVLATLMMDYII
jgi:magnesium transporter